MNIDKLEGNVSLKPGVTPESKPADRGRGANTASSGSEELTLSNAARSLVSSRESAEIDSQRVEQIRTAIAEGRYPIDADALAATFIELEAKLDR